MALFEEPQALVSACKETYAEGYRRIDAFTPFPIHDLAIVLGYRHRVLPKIVLVGAILGGLAGFFLQYWVSVIQLPANVGGRPFNSLPAFIPVTFECTILAAALTTVLGMLALNGLPRPYHPVFNAPRFHLATRNRFFLCIESADPKFDRRQTQEFLQKLGPSSVTEVEY
jgi:hypothetical protein